MFDILFCDGFFEPKKTRLETNRRPVFFSACELRSETVREERMMSLYNQQTSA